MTNINSDEAQHKRDELNQDRVGCRPTPATATRRNLSATKPSAPRNSPSNHGPQDPRFDYLTHSHD